ncbi:MAG: polymer-forming cytoskeletal protein [Candidatus Egerieousia sp.]
MAINHTLPHVNDISRLAANTKVTGDITCVSDIRIDGILIGNISTKGKLVLGEEGLVEGNITCREADIYGKCTGDITGVEQVLFKSKAVYKGILKTAHVGIEMGASFSGSCSIISDEEARRIIDSIII